jgi:hypothetical protein
VLAMPRALVASEGSWRWPIDLLNDPAATCLIGAVLADPQDEWAIARRYLSDSSMALLDQTCHTENVQPAGEVADG